jgi:tRNA (guanine-N7-)-methyltransferase
MSAARENAINELLPLKNIDQYQAPVNLAQVSGSKDVVIDFGCGMGDHSLGLMRNQPDTHVLAMDVHTAGITNILMSAHQQELLNFSVHLGDGIDVLRDVIAPETVSEIHILFPDPWPKERQQKRRLIQPDFLKLAHKVLIPGGILRFATDDDGYAQQTFELLSSLDGWTKVLDDWQAPETNYHQRALRLEHTIHVMSFSRT